MVRTRQSKGGSKGEADVEEVKPVPSPPRSKRRSNASAAPEESEKELEASGFDSSAPIRFDEDTAYPQELSQPPIEPRKEQAVAKRQPKTARRRTLRGFFGSLGLLYLFATYFLTCRNNTASDNPVCKAFDAADEARTEVLHFLHGHAKPHLDRANAYVEPYAAHVRPHYSRATSFAKPYATQASKAYSSHVHPHITNAQKQAQAAASPYLAQASAYHAKTLQPQLSHYQRIGQKLHSDHIEPNLKRGQAAVKPYLDHAQNVLGPEAQRYYSDVAAPYASKTYRTSRDTYVNQVHPHLASSWSTFVSFLKSHIFPLFSRWNAVYVQPQVDRVKEKIFEAKTKKAASEAVVDAAAKEREIAKEEKVDELDAFIEDLRQEALEPEIEEADVLVAAPSYTQVKASTEDTKVKEENRKVYEQAISEKRTKLEAERDRYESEIDQLAKTERILLVQRLNSVRAAAVRDIPARFDVRVNDIKYEASKLQGKLERYFERVLGDEKIDVDEKVADAELITNKAVTRLARKAEEIQDELDAYGRSLSEKESAAVQTAFDAVKTLVGIAQTSLGNGWTWLEDVSVADWTRYHQLAKTEDKIHGDYRALADGKASDPQLDSSKPHHLVTTYKDEVDELVDGFESALHKARKAGIKRLRGSVGDSVRAVFDSAKSVVGFDAPATTTESGYSASAPSVYSVASRSAASLADAVASNIPDAQGASASAASAYSVASSSVASLADTVVSNIPDAAGAAALAHEATRAASRALGATPSPESPQEYAASVYARASEGVFREPAASGVSASISSAAKLASASASSLAQVAGSSASSLYSAAADSVGSSLPSFDDASSVLHDATRSAIRAVGATPSPEGAAEHVESLYAKASQAVAGEPAASGVSASVSSAARAASSAISSAAVVGGSSASSIYTELSKSVSSGLPASSELSSSLHDATRAAARAVGIQPSPEGVAEHASSVYARASGAVVGSPAPLASSISSSVSSLANSVSSYGTVAASSASSLASVASVSASSTAVQAASSASSLYGDAVKSGSSIASSLSNVVVGTPAASGASASISSAFSAVSASASSAVHEATRSVIRAAGGEPAPEKPAEHLESATRVVSRKLATASQDIEDAVRAAKEAAEKVRQRLEL